MMDGDPKRWVLYIPTPSPYLIIMFKRVKKGKFNVFIEDSPTKLDMDNNFCIKDVTGKSLSKWIELALAI